MQICQEEGRFTGKFGWKMREKCIFNDLEGFFEGSDEKVDSEIVSERNRAGNVF